MIDDTLPRPRSTGVLEPGDLVGGKYRIEGVLGKGGMGVVYVAQHELLLQKVAIKVLLPEIVGMGEAVARFMNEARAAAAIQSEHIARVLDVGHHDGSPYMVMEFLEGNDLGHVLASRGPLPVPEVVDAMLEALEALAQAHALQIVHRDLKPANLFLSRRQDGQSVVKVLDFGISKAQNPLGPISGGMTSTKAMLGSPFYMSPEQLRSSKSVDARTDIWSAGVIMYELLTSTLPYNGENLGELFAAILEQPVQPLREKRPEVPPDVEQIVMRCLQRAPEHRFQSARELAAALARFATPRGLVAAGKIQASTLGAIPATTPFSPNAASVYMPQQGLAQSKPGGAPSSPNMPALAQQGTPVPYGSASGSGVSGAAPAGLQPGSGTQATWGQTGGAPSGSSKRGLIAALAGVGLLVVLALAVGGVRVMRGRAAAAGAASIPSAPVALAPPPVVDIPPQVALPPPTSVAALAPDAGATAGAVALTPGSPPPRQGRPGGAQPPARTTTPPPATVPTTSAPSAPSAPSPPAGRVDDLPGAGRK